MGRNKRPYHKHDMENRFGREDSRYSRRGFRDEDDEDDNSRMNRYSRRGRFGRNEEEEERERYGRSNRNRSMRNRFDDEDDEDDREVPEELKDLEEEVWEYIEEIKKEDPELFCMLKCDLWKAIKGPHFDEDYVEDALEEVAEHFGKREPRWKCEEAKQIAEKFGVKFGEEFNKHDWTYALNLMYFLFSSVLQDNLQSYAKCAHAWLKDECIPDGKAFWHFHRFLKSKEEE